MLEHNLFSKIVKGWAFYEATTPDLSAVTENADTNSHLCEGCLVIIHPCLAADCRADLSLSNLLKYKGLIKCGRYSPNLRQKWGKCIKPDKCVFSVPYGLKIQRVEVNEVIT